MMESGHYRDLWSISDKLRGASSYSLRRNLVYSATLTISRRLTELRKKKKKAVSKRDVLGGCGLVLVKGCDQKQYAVICWGGGNSGIF